MIFEPILLPALLGHIELGTEVEILGPTGQPFAAGRLAVYREAALGRQYGVVTAEGRLFHGLDASQLRVAGAEASP